MQQGGGADAQDKMMEGEESERERKGGRQRGKVMNDTHSSSSSAINLTRGQQKKQNNTKQICESVRYRVSP